jgi:hypothetical protein
LFVVWRHGNLYAMVASLRVLPDESVMVT